MKFSSKLAIGMIATLGLGLVSGAALAQPHGMGPGTVPAPQTPAATEHSQ